MKAREMNFDGIIGPSHHYGGLSFGNLASMDHKNRASNPKKAALQGLAKMRLMHQLGIPQGVFPPHERPYLPLFRALGYRGSDKELLEQVWKQTPELVIASSSAASMWTANAATVSPSADSEDGRVHLTPANLCSNFHRSFEAPFTTKILKTIFSDPNYFEHHDALPSQSDFADEGAANHMRLCPCYGEPGIQFFVYGREGQGFKGRIQGPHRFPARQTLEASQAIARLHRLHKDRTAFIQQNPDIIDLGVFHNDVIAVSNENVLLAHEMAFIHDDEKIRLAKERVPGFCFIPVSKEQVTIEEAVRSYLFNSQLVTIGVNEMALIAPIECEESESVSKFLKELLEDSCQPIRGIYYLNLRESMQNGGGPACLRLRVVLTDKEFQALPSSIIFCDKLDKQLVNWIERHYRDELYPHELGDPKLLEETQKALNELTHILGLGSIYSFQK